MPKLRVANPGAWLHLFPSKEVKLVITTCLLFFFTACQSGPGLLTQNSSAEKTSKDATTAFQLFTDIPIPAGTSFDVGNSLILGSGEGWTGRLIVTLSKNPADAFAVYTVEMPEFGWKPIASVQSETSVLTFTRGDRAATIEIEARAITGSLVRITMTPHGSTNSLN
ncbi:MAG: hypothetical protein VX884_02445 [Pseudomonadota bacterium]|nr:hypothetical protein [Pseudomonadota bacterium]